MAVLGMANSRMKDYFDVWMLLHTFELDPQRLRRAVDATFARRGTATLSVVPEGLSDAYSGDPTKQRQWAAFAANLSSPAPGLRQLVVELSAKLVALLELQR